MKISKAHIVHSLRYEVQFEDNNISNPHNDLSQLHHEKIGQLLQNAFDKLSVEGKHIQINTFELDLGMIAPDNWQNDFVSQLNKELYEKLNDIIIKEASLIDILKKPGFLAEDWEVIVQSEAEQKEDFFLFFLEKGFLKWNVSSTSVISINKIFEALIESYSERFHEQLSSLLINSDVALQRFISQIYRELLVSWLKHIAKGTEILLMEIENILPNQLQHYFKVPQATIDKFSLWLKNKLIRYILANAPELPNTVSFIETYHKDIADILLPNITKEMLGKVSFSEDIAESNILHLIIQKLSENEQIITEKIERQEKLKRKKTKKDPKTKDIDTGTESGTISKNRREEIVKAEQGKENKDKEINTDIDIKENAREDFERGLHASNAGLIILWPYLKPLFDEFHLIKRNQFNGEEEYVKALFILHYLATGQMQAEEHELLIPKIITGCSSEINVPLEMMLEESVLKECDTLLKAVIKNWSVLKSTSPDGLRQAFLQREAFIKAGEESWEFLFERKGMDVLLEHLPYGLSVIKFRWLDNPIYVTW